MEVLDEINKVIDRYLLRWRLLGVSEAIVQPPSFLAGPAAMLAFLVVLMVLIKFFFMASFLLTLRF